MDTVNTKGAPMQNPFSTTFSRLPERSYVSTTAPREIIDNFSFDNPTEAVFKITGLRGSGKTVILSAVQKHFFTNMDGWLVYTLNPSRDMRMHFRNWARSILQKAVSCP